MNNQGEQVMVSVLMTVYNRDQYIKEAVESVLASTYTNFELIIVDDCSTDRSVEIIKKFVKEDSRIRFYRNDKNLGDYPNRNKATSYAIGKYIKFVDSDDAIFKWGLQYCVEHMEKYPEAALGTLCFKEDIAESMISSSIVIEEHFFKKELLNIGPSGTIFRRDKFEQIGFFNTRFGIASDMYINIKLAALYPVILLPKVFFFYRQHEGQQLHNSYFAYLENNYLYQQQLLTENILPLKEIQISSLKKKIKRDLAYNLLKSVAYPSRWAKARTVAHKTKFGILSFIKSI